MPSLELKTNVKLDDPKAFIQEFSTVRSTPITCAHPCRLFMLIVLSVVLCGSAEEAACVYLRVVHVQRVPCVGGDV